MYIMSKKKTRKKNNRYFSKRVSRKRVSKRVSRKRVSRKRKRMRGGMEGSAQGVAHTDDSMDPENYFRQKNEESIPLLRGKIEEKQATVDLLRGMGENPEVVKREILELQGILKEYEASQPSEPEATALEPEQVADFGGIAGGPIPDAVEIDDDLKFVLIPGSDNAWGKNRIPYHTKVRLRQDYNPGHWQSTIEDLIGDENILKSGPDYNGTDEFHCGDKRNKPYIERYKLREATDTHKEAPLGSTRFGAPEMRRCVENIFKTNSDVNKSVICTSQGSAILFDIISQNPDILYNIRSIVIVSPAFSFEGQQRSVVRTRFESFLRECEDKNTRILLLLTEYQWGKWEPERSGWNGDLIKSGVCKAVFVPNTTHSFDICNGCPKWPPEPPPSTQPNANNTPLPPPFLNSIIKWCINPIDIMEGEVVRTSGGKIVEYDSTTNKYI